MKFSVIIPVYNVEAYIIPCVNSCLIQTFDEFEVILVDDGSTDGSGLICDSFGEKDNRVRTIHQKNAGLSEARNVGICEARGEYLVFLDSDDYLAPYALEDMYNVIDKSNADVVLECSMFSDVEGTIIESVRQKREEFVGINGKTAVSLLIEGEIPQWSACSKCYKRKFWLDNDFSFKKRMKAEDFELIYKVIYKAPVVAMLDRAVYFYRRNRANSITTNIDYNYIMSLFEAIDSWEIFFLENDVDVNLVVKFRRVFSDLIFNYIIPSVLKFEGDDLKCITDKLNKMGYVFNDRPLIKLAIKTRNARLIYFVLIMYGKYNGLKKRLFGVI